VQLAAGLTVNVGEKVIINGTDGSCKTRGSTTTCDVAGVAESTLTAGSNNDLLLVRLQIQLIP
jgi:hypothetical protein